MESSHCNSLTASRRLPFSADRAFCEASSCCLRTKFSCSKRLLVLVSKPTLLAFANSAVDYIYTYILKIACNTIQYNTIQYNTTTQNILYQLTCAWYKSPIVVSADVSVVSSLPFSLTTSAYTNRETTCN